MADESPWEVGDTLVCTHKRIRARRDRTVTILEVSGSPDKPRYRIRWSDGYGEWVMGLSLRCFVRQLGGCK